MDQLAKWKRHRQEHRKAAGTTSLPPEWGSVVVPTTTGSNKTSDTAVASGSSDPMAGVPISREGSGGLPCWMVGGDPSPCSGGTGGVLPGSAFETAAVGRRSRGSEEGFAEGSVEQEACVVARCAKWIAIDTETSGFGASDGIIALAAVEFATDGSRTGREFTAQANPFPLQPSSGPTASPPPVPEPLSPLPSIPSFTLAGKSKDAAAEAAPRDSFQSVHPRALEKHGMTTEQVRTFPPLAEVVVAWLQFLLDSFGDTEDAVGLVFHNASFDLRFVRRALAQLDVEALQPLLLLGAKGESADRCQLVVDAIFKSFGLQAPASIQHPESTTNASCPPSASSSSEVCLPIVCTLRLFRRMYPTQPSDLESCLRFVGRVERRISPLHGALEDATLAGLLFSALSATLADALHNDDDEGVATSNVEKDVPTESQ